jgi:hypothetical protein
MVSGAVIGVRLFDSSARGGARVFPIVESVESEIDQEAFQRFATDPLAFCFAARAGLGST